MADQTTTLFAAQVDEWVRKTKARIEAVVKNAAESVVEEVISRTPRDTGFLAASLQASLNGPIPLRDAPPADAQPGQFARPTSYALVIDSMPMGGTVFIGFSANYAAHVEFGTKHQNPAAMVRLSTANWPYHVEAAIRAAKAAVASRSPR